MKLAVSVLPNILVAVGEGIGALAVVLVVPEFPDLLGAVCVGEGALAVALTVPVLPDILVAAGKGVSALAVRPTGGRHIGITRRQSALPKGWHGQTNEKGENDSHWHILTRGHT